MDKEDKNTFSLGGIAGSAGSVLAVLLINGGIKLSRTFT